MRCGKLGWGLVLLGTACGSAEHSAPRCGGGAAGSDSGGSSATGGSGGSSAAGSGGSGGGVAGSGGSAAGSGGSVGAAAGSGGAGGAAGGPSCRRIEVWDVVAAADGVATGVITPQLGGPDPEVFRFDLRKPVEPHSGYSLDASPDDNFATCERCVRVIQYATPPAAPTQYFQTSGTLALGAADGSDGALYDAVLVEVEHDPQTSRSTPVPGGNCLVITEASWHTSCADGGIEHTGADACPLCVNQAYKACCSSQTTRCNEAAGCASLYHCSAECKDDMCRQACAEAYPDAVESYSGLVACLFGDSAGARGACGVVCE